MAQKVVVEMIDDIDGKAATQTVPFALDGATYEIDLSNDNAANLRDELARYISAGRRTGGRKVQLATRESVKRSRERSQTIRAWAQENDYTVSERGRIPSRITNAFEQAQRENAAAPKIARPSMRKTAST